MDKESGIRRKDLESQQKVGKGRAGNAWSCEVDIFVCVRFFECVRKVCRPLGEEVGRNAEERIVDLVDTSQCNDSCLRPNVMSYQDFDHLITNEQHWMLLGSIIRDL
jgi:hypothetical protein